MHHYEIVRVRQQFIDAVNYWEISLPNAATGQSVVVLAPVYGTLEQLGEAMSEQSAQVLGEIVAQVLRDFGDPAGGGVPTSLPVPGPAFS